ncbi:MAG: anti-sigma-D factor RsdA [Pseudonocardia sediminis]
MRDLGNHGSDRRPPRPDDTDPFGNVRQGRFGTNGHAHAAAPTHRFEYELDDEGPVDLVELQADDELINALSSGMGMTGSGRGGYDSDDRLVAMLASWKADVDAEPIPALVEPDVAAQMLQPSRPSRRGVSYLRPIAAAAAVAAVALAAVSIGAHEAVPGDTLWGVSKVLYSERAEQVQAASDLRTGIERVNAKLAAGDTVGAQQDLAALAPLLSKVEPGQQQTYFSQQSDFLVAKVAETPPGTPTDPSAPLRNGTAAPQPPAAEGSADPAPVPGPSSGPSPAAPNDPSSGAGTSGPGAGTPSQGTTDPRTVQEPGAPGPTPADPSTSPTTSPTPPPSPTPEGSVDPTTTGPTTRPTASGEGTQDTTPSSSTSGAVSSTPN